MRAQGVQIMDRNSLRTLNLGAGSTWVHDQIKNWLVWIVRILQFFVVFQMTFECLKLLKLQC